MSASTIPLRSVGAAGGPFVSAIGVGTWVVGGRGYGPADDAELSRLINHAIDRGVTLFDTAPAYGGGLAEELLGKALGSRRRDVLVVSKGGLTIDGGRITRRDSSLAALERDLEASLRRLSTDYVDFYLIHWPDRTVPIADAAAGIERLRASGKVRYVGVSNFRAAELREACGRAPIVANQIGYNLFDRRWEWETFEAARELGVSIMAYSPLAHGLLSGRYRPDHQFSSGDWRASGRTLVSQDLFLPENFRTNVQVVDDLKPIAARLGCGVPALAIGWTLRDPIVAAAIVGPRRVDQLDESLAAAAVTIPRDALAEIDQVMAGAAGLVSELPE